MASSMHAEGEQDVITLNLLCPSIPAPNSFLFHDLPLSSTVEELQTRITDRLPNHPPRAIQKLIARGKHLSNGNATLREVLAPIDGHQLTIHLMLPLVSTATQNVSQPREAPLPRQPAHVDPVAPATFSSANLRTPNLVPPPLPEQLVSPEQFASLASQVRAIKEQVSQIPQGITIQTVNQAEAQQSNVFIAYCQNSVGLVVSPTSVCHGKYSIGNSIPQFAVPGQSGFGSSSPIHGRGAMGTNANINVPPQPNAVNQAQVDPRRAGGGGGGGGAFLFRNLWLFIRIFIFVYLFSDPGTWTRWIMTIGSLAIIFLAETEVLQVVHDTIVAPARRYLEGLAHTRQGNQQPADGNGNGALGRAILLLLASLVPGIGERQVQVRQAADAEAEAERHVADEAEAHAANEAEAHVADEGQAHVAGDERQQQAAQQAAVEQGRAE